MREKLLKMTDEEIKSFIRERLKFEDLISNSIKHMDYETKENEHYRFNFDGGFIDNMDVVKKFKDCGIYDYVTFFALSSAEGNINIVYCWRRGEDAGEIFVKDELDGLGTIEIILEVIKKLYIEPKIEGREVFRVID